MSSDAGNRPTLDDKVIDQLRQDMGDEAGMVIASYLDSIGEYLLDIENRTVRTRRSDLHRWAHTIKSSARSIGAMQLAYLAEQLERAYAEQRQVDLAGQLRSMQREYDRVSASLEEIDLD